MTTKPHSRFCIFAVVISLCIAPSLCVAEDGKNDEPFPKGLQGKVEHGRTIFQDSCIRCHAQSGDGQGPDVKKLDLKPLSFQTDSFRTEFSRRDIFTGTALGKLGTHMPTWLKNMDDQDVADVSEYIYQRFVLRQIDHAN